jgi:riboflavin kinase/FMN adenylyltransferase
VNIQNKTYKGVLNIGTNPTTDNDNSQKIEVHILNFNEDIYHQKIQISFLKKIRDEEKFDSIESLKNQILQDIEWCKNG